MFDIHQPIRRERGDEIDEQLVQQYIGGLMEEFAAAPEAQPILQEYGDISWAGMMMEYAFNYLGTSIPKMSLADFNEVVFDLFPRKVSTPAESAPAIIAELQAFWSFLHRQYGLANARRILDSLTEDAARRLEQKLADPRNFGMAKSFVMQGVQAGYDMTTQEGVDAFMRAYNSSLAAGGPAGGMPFDPGPFAGGLGWGLEPFGPMRDRADREKKRKARKAQRQARKRNRR